MDKPYVRACKALVAAHHFVDQNALWAQIVRQTKHVVTTNVLTHAWGPVEWKRNVSW